MGSDGGTAASAKALEKGSFGGHAGPGIGTVQGAGGGGNPVIATASLEGNRALTWGGEHLGKVDRGDG